MSKGMPHAAQLNFVADSWDTLDDMVQGKGRHRAASGGFDGRWVQLFPD